MLYRKVQNIRRDQNMMQFMLPTKFHLQAMKACHDDIGHLGMECSLDLLRDRWYWPSMTNDIESHIKICDHCLKFKSKPHKTELQNTEVSHPLKLVHIDFLMI